MRTDRSCLLKSSSTSSSSQLSSQRWLVVVGAVSDEVAPDLVEARWASEVSDALQSRCGESRQ